MFSKTTTLVKLFQCDKVAETVIRKNICQANILRKLSTDNRSVHFNAEAKLKDTAESVQRNPSKIKILPAQELTRFRSHFPNIVKDLTTDDLVTDLDEVKERLSRIVNYNIPTGKQIRASIFIDAYKFLRNEQVFIQKEMDDVHRLAWCIEMMASYILMMDDIVDNSETRRGKKTWFKHIDVGLNAINDGTLVQLSTFKLISKYFSNHKHYADLLNVFVEANLKTFVGQAMDCDQINVKKLTEQRFRDIADNKTGYYTFYFPIVSAMYLANRSDLELHKEGLNIFKELGRFYQFQNDYLDCYGDSYSGKIGTDIQEGKCSWLILSAYKKSSPNQKKILEECYGKWNMYCVKKVKAIYDELDLESSYEAEVQKYTQRINCHLSTINNQVTRKLLKRLSEMCFGYE